MAKASSEVKQDFIEKLSAMSDEDIQTYIKENGKNNSNDKLFVFNWDNINPKNKND